MTYKPFRIAVPWPDKRLSPNARVHWAAKSKAAKTARDIAALKTKIWLMQNGEADPDACIMAYVFHPKDNRRRDDDNLAASMKPSRDGIAQALGIDDHRLYTGRAVIMPADKLNPRVEIEIVNPI
jgi:crossover junction endodeoxyribonuclease RusA